VPLFVSINHQSVMENMRQFLAQVDVSEYGEGLLQGKVQYLVMPFEPTRIK
jgi:hypothetical protein